MAIKMKINIKSNAGVALIQVLLITMMLLILVIKLSQEADHQVQVAIKAKQRAQLDIDLYDAKQKLKFALAVDDKERSSAETLGRNWNFYGEAFALNPNVVVRLQDESGRLSLPYAGSELSNWLGDNDVYKQLRVWQGLAESGSPNRAPARGGLFQSLSEATLVPGWPNGRKLIEVTHLPTDFFNMYNAPRSLLQNLFSAEIALRLEALRRDGNSSQAQWNADAGNQYGFMVTKAPGDKILATLSAEGGNFEIAETTRFWLSLESTTPIVEIMQ